MPRHFRLATACLAVIALAGCQPATDDTARSASAAANGTAGTPAPADAVAGVTVTGAWIRETPPNAAVAGGYLTLRSAGGDRLVAVETPAAASVEIHEMRHDGGMMRMRELTDGVPLPAGTEVTLAPGGNHLMFIGPVEPVRAGQAVEATLVFEQAPRQTVTFDVRPLAGDAPAADAHGH